MSVWLLLSLNCLLKKLLAKNNHSLSRDMARHASALPIFNLSPLPLRRICIAGVELRSAPTNSPA
jgi:hypothetical protein